ncbi:MAG: hypothetical protein WC651_01070 [Candidatus Gracilibacteria bacterium]|jgi:hypothetical protein
MNNLAHAIFNSVDVIVAILLGIWLVYTKGKLTTKEKPILKIPPKWLYIGGYILIIGGILKAVEALS